MWILSGKEFKEEDIPEEAIGFIYKMTCVVNGHEVGYIGKKNFFADIKTKLSIKSSPVDKRKKTYKRVRRFTYQNYFSSNEDLKQYHKDGIPIKREILMICFSKSELTYQEVKHQFAYGVLEKEQWLNRNILGKFYKGKIK